MNFKNSDLENPHSLKNSSLFPAKTELIIIKFYTEAKRCFATHDEDIDYFKDSSTLYIY